MKTRPLKLLFQIQERAKWWHEMESDLSRVSSSLPSYSVSKVVVEGTRVWLAADARWVLIDEVGDMERSELP